MWTGCVSIDNRNSMKSVRHRHSGVNQGKSSPLTLVIVLCTSKLRKKLKGGEKAKVWLRIEMVVTDDIMVICLTK